MKKFRIIGMLLATIIMGVSFTSCNPDDKKEKPAKKLVKFSNEASETTFKYDEQGHLIECVQIYTSLTNIYTYVWGENSIGIIFDLNGIAQIESTLDLENGLSSGISDEPLFYEYFFKYDSNDRLIECRDNMTTSLLEWNDDKLIKNHYEDPACIGIDTYSYDKNYTTEGHNPLISHFVTREPLYVAHPELAGLATNKVYNNETCYVKTDTDEYTRSYKYEYVFDEDGYINKATIKRIEENGETIIDEYIMVWE